MPEPPPIVNTTELDRSVGAWGYLRPILLGLLIAAAGLVPWLLLAARNRHYHPEVPWAAVTTVAYLAIMLVWLNGWGWPRATAAERRRSLRLWPRTPAPEAGRGTLPVPAIVALLALLTVVWTAFTRTPLPDLSAYPTTAYRWSLFLMGGILSGVVEEAAFRGYMLTGLERRDPANANVITSVVFVGVHLTHGLQTVLLLGPGLFAASLLYGALARRTGSILPGMAIHVLGDLAHTYFGVLRGDGSLLFVAG